MSENTGAYEPGIYVKGDAERVAKSTRDAVALAFQGFKLKVETVEVSPSADLSFPHPETPVVPRPPANSKPTDPKDKNA